MSDFLFGCAVGSVITVAVIWLWVHNVIQTKFAELKQHISDEIKRKARY